LECSACHWRWFVANSPQLRIKSDAGTNPEARDWTRFRQPETVMRETANGFNC
jgi:hypothetical protein